jgi:ribosomal protein S9
VPSGPIKAARKADDAAVTLRVAGCGFSSQAGTLRKAHEDDLFACEPGHFQLGERVLHCLSATER